MDTKPKSFASGFFKPSSKALLTAALIVAAFGLIGGYAATAASAAKTSQWHQLIDRVKQSLNPRMAESLRRGTNAVSAPMAGTISLTTFGAAYTQNFDTLASTAVSSTVPLGWSFVETGTNADSNYAVGIGSSATGDTYSFGAFSNAERALGGLQSTTLVPTIGASFTNNTGGIIASLAISYTGEQWRLGALSRLDQLDFQYSINATSLTTGTWIDVNPLDFIAPTTTPTVGALNGNVAPNRTAISNTISSLSIANGAVFWIRWNDFNPIGNDDGLAVDDFSLTPSPTLPDLTITKTHTGSFVQGSTGNNYTVTVTNSGLGSKSAGQAVSVTDAPPAGLTVTAMSGTGWTCTVLPTCTRNDVLSAGSQYPAITVTVSVAANATSPQVNSVSVTTVQTESNSGNNTATDSTGIAAPTTTTLTSSPNPSFTGGSVTFTATVTSSTTVNTGTVTFTEGVTPLASNVAVVSGVASFNTSALIEGTHTITATYSGTATLGASSGSVTHVVNNQTVVTGNQFCNPGGISIPAAGAGSPYPSNIFVSGIGTQITKVTLTLNGLSHTTPDDVDILLVGPGGQKFVVMSDAGGSVTAVTNLNLTLDDAGGSSLPDASTFSSGTFKPTDHDATDTFPSPAPAAPYSRPAPSGASTFAALFNTTNPNGTWQLYVVDDNAGNSGSISGGWCLTITTVGNTTISNVTDTPDPSVVGQPYTVGFTLNVTPPGTGTPTGTVTVTDGTGGTCTATLPATSCSITSMSAGVKTLTITYGGDPNFNGSGTTAGHLVNKADTTTLIAADNPDPSVTGQSVVVNFTVVAASPGTGTPGGNVIVTVSGGVETCSGTVAAGSCVLALNTVGNRTLTATYAGDSNFNGSLDTESHQVAPADTTTAITSDNPDPSAPGQNVTVVFSVLAVAPGGGTPSGNITVTASGGAETCSGSVASGSCILVLTTPGIRTLTAMYGGDANYSASSDTEAHQVNSASTSLTGITDSPDPSVVGEPYSVGFTLNVTPPASGTPTGTVTVTDGAGGTCTATLPATSCSITSSTAGVKTLTVTYNGDSNFDTSSTTAGHQVNKGNTTSTITADNPDPSVAGEVVVVTFTVVATAPATGTPTGNVVVTISGGAETCSASIATGSCFLALTSVGGRTMTATYAGDANYNGSAVTEAHQVNKADTVTTIVSDNPDSSGVGQNVTVVFTIVALAPGAGTPSGNVTVIASGGAETCTGTVASGSCVLALTTSGSRTLTATYVGEATFNGSSDTESHTVLLPPGIAKEFAPATTPVGGISTLTFTITNPAANSLSMTGLTFTDTFPAGLVVANPLTTNNTCGGTLSDNTSGALAPGALGVRLSGGTVGVSPNNTCTVSVSVTPTSSGPLVNVSGNIGAANGGTGNTATATLKTNTPPTISSNAITVKAGSNAASFTIATAVDPDQPVNTLGITIHGNPTTASTNGVTVSAVTITPAGAVTANVATTCAATTATFSLVITDNETETGTGTLTVNVIANTPPVLSYNPAVVTAATTPLIPPAVGPGDNGTVTSIILQSIAPNNGGLTVTVNNVTGQVQVTGATLSGLYSVNIAVTDNCNATTLTTLSVSVVCPTITLSPASLPNATVNTAYGQSISASPAGGNYTFAVTSGTLPAGLTLNPNGSFSGAPTVSGLFNFRATASGFGGCTGFRDYTLLVVCPTITVNPASLPGGTVGTAYSQSVSASPAGSYSYSVSSGSLPTGLALNASTGAITGTPTTTGVFSFAITAAVGGCTGSLNYSVTIGCPTLTISPATLPNGQVGSAYSQAMTVTPSGTYTFSLVVGNLPSGLTLNGATGVISGSPTISGSYNFTVKAATASGCSGTHAYTLVIACPVITVFPAVSLPAGTKAVFYSQTFSATPAGGGYTFAKTSGTLPTGLTLNPATGVLSGTPTATGTFNFRITASGFGGCTGFRDYTLVVGNGVCPTITLTATLPNGSVGSLYNNLVIASPSGTYSYTVNAGSLPPGVTFYGSIGLLFGYPTTAGVYNFTITATDSNACNGSNAYTVNIGLGNALAATEVALVSAASYQAGAATPGGIMAAFGNGLATKTEPAATIPLPTELAGTTVIIKDSAGVEYSAPLFFVSPEQVNFQIPDNAALGEAVLTMTSADGSINLVTTVIVPVRPGLFAANGDGVGAVAGFYVHAAGDHSQVLESTAILDSVTGLYVPSRVTFGAESEELFLVLHGTALRGRSGLEAVTVKVGGVIAEVTYAGPQGGYVGLDQVNVRLPRILVGRGEVEIEVIVEGREANTLRIRLH
ncbi:MAG: Ig-like domain repeat protein [Acidobacteriota bacterium]